MPRFSENDPAAWIVKQSNNYPLLTAEQEILYSRQVQAWLALQDVAQPSKAQQRIIKRGKRAYDLFYLCNIRLVVSIANRYSRVSGTLEVDDLVQEGLMGLQRAIEKFDPTRGYKFSTYSYYWIRQAINRAISCKSRTIRLPFSGSDLIKQAMEFVNEHERRHGRLPRLEMVAEHCGKQVETLCHYLAHNASVLSLDSRVTSNRAIEASTYLELLAEAAEEPRLLDEMEDVCDKLEMAMTKLTPKQREVIERRYGNRLTKPPAFNKIADEIGMTRQSAQTCHNKGIKKLRALLLESLEPHDIRALQSAA